MKKNITYSYIIFSPQNSQHNVNKLFPKIWLPHRIQNYLSLKFLYLSNSIVSTSSDTNLLLSEYTYITFKGWEMIMSIEIFIWMVGVHEKGGVNYVYIWQIGGLHFHIIWLAQFLVDTFMKGLSWHTANEYKIWQWNWTIRCSYLHLGH